MILPWHRQASDSLLLASLSLDGTGSGSTLSLSGQALGWCKRAPPSPELTVSGAVETYELSETSNSLLFWRN